MIKWINKLSKYNINLFQINDFQSDKQIIYNTEIKQNEIDKYSKKSINFIFQKDKKPEFLNKYMKVDLGVFVLTNEFKEIGSVTIQNNYNEMLEYEIKKINDIIIPHNINNRMKLEKNKDLIIEFDLNKHDLKPDFYKNEIELILYKDREECDKCIIYVYINIIPLILKFSLNNEKFSLNENIINIHHYIKDFKITYSLPGNYIPKNLGIKLNISNKKNINIDNNKINIISNREKKESLNYEFSLFLKEKENQNELNLKIDFEKPEKFDLIIFDENKIIIEENNDKNNDNSGKNKLIKGIEKTIYAI